MDMFDDFAPDVNLTRIEEEVRRFWLLHRTARQVREMHAADPRFRIHQPPLGVTAPAAMSRAQLLCTADLLARYSTMQGFHAEYHLGWSCHGLAVEMEVERSSEQGGAQTDLEDFTNACRDLAIGAIEQDQALAHRLGVWLDPDLVYATLSPGSVGDVWSALRRLWEQGRLRSELRVVDTCPRCATPLSVNEATSLTDRSESDGIYVHLPWEGEADAYFLIWAPSPWMLVDMVALAVHPEVKYALVEVPSEGGKRAVRYVLAETALDRVMTGDYRLLKRLSARSLRSARYRPAFTFVPSSSNTNRVVISDAVLPGDGTGLQPVTPTFHGPSLAIAQANSLPIPKLIDQRCRLDDSITPWRGLTPLEAEPHITHDLESRGLVYAKKRETQRRSLCPYCESSILSTLRHVWLTETAHGAWVLGRDRAWGVPLPIWICASCGGQVCVTGLDDLAYRAGKDISAIDPHRPAVDQLVLPCEACGGAMRRISPVVDEAFESAIAVLDGMHQPNRLLASAPQSTRSILICRQSEYGGWLERSGEVADLLGEALVWDEASVLPELDHPLEQHPGQTPLGDAIRWAILAGTTPDAAERDLLRPLCKMATALQTGRSDSKEEGPLQLGTGVVLLDRWLMARVGQTARAVSEALDRRDWQGATLLLSGLVNDYCGWYQTHRKDGGAAIIGPLLKLLAPFIPHLAEAIHLRLGGSNVKSIHRTRWPPVASDSQEPEILGQVALVRQLEALGLQARKLAGIEADRQLPLALVGPSLADATQTQALVLFTDLIGDVLDVSRVQFRTHVTTEARWKLALDRQKVTRRELDADEIHACLGNLEPREAEELAWQLLSGRSVSLPAACPAVTLLPDEVLVSLSPRPGWAASAGGGYFVLLAIQ